MRFIERIKESFREARRLGNERAADQVARYQGFRDIEDFSRKTLMPFYTESEERINQILLEMQSMGRSSGITILRPQLQHTIHASLNKQIGNADEGRENITDMVLRVIPNPQRRMNCHIDILREAINFWENKLAQPDNPGETVFLGRRRLTKFKHELEQLTGTRPE